MLVPEFCENKMSSLPDEFYRSLPQYCIEDGCGYPMEMSEALTQLHCSNPRCPSKVIQRLLAIAQQLGIKDLGEAKASKLIHTYGLTNPLLIFAYEPDVDGAMGEGISLEMSNKIMSQFKDKKSFTLAEYVRIANLPFIQTSAITIFGDYDDLGDAYNDIERGGVEFIAQKLNIKKSEDSEDISLRALKIYDSLMTFKDDLFQGIKYVTIIKTHTSGMIRLKAVCSDEVGTPFRTKADFYSTCNNRRSDVHIEFLNAVTKDIDYLVWAGASGAPARYTNKVKKTEGYNAKYEEHKEAGTLKTNEHYIPIVTAGQFLDILDKL